MFSVITNIYNKKKNQATYLHSNRKTENVFFWQLEMFAVCTTGDTAHIDTLFKFLPHTRQHECIDTVHCCNYPCLKVSEVTWQWCDEYLARNARCTVTTDLLCDIPTHKTTSSPERPFFSLRTLASPSGRNVNYNEKTIYWGGGEIELFLLSVQVS